MDLQGLGIGGYRSYREIQRFGPLARINFLAGPNNSGKSNVLRFLNEWLPRAIGKFVPTELAATQLTADPVLDFVRR